MNKGKPSPKHSGETPPEPQRAGVGRLRSLLLSGKEPILLLGAGASVTSGIPAAGTTVEKVARWAWCQDQGRHPEDYTIRRSDYWPWVTGQPWFNPTLGQADLYPDAIENLLGVQNDRRRFFEDLINPKNIPPSRGYRALALILQQGWISTVLTTNFDECLQRAVILENKPHRLVTINTKDDHILFSAAPHDPQLIYLHGSVKHYTDKNLTAEVQTLDSDLIEKIVPLFRDHPVVVVGYRGTEASVMQDLFIKQSSNANGFVHGVFWCVLVNSINDPLSDYVRELHSKIGSNFQLVAIDGFDDLIERDLFEQMRAEGATSTRRPTGFGVGQVPTDMQVLAAARYSDLERPLLHARLSQYANRTDLWSPTDKDEAWVDQMAERLDLVKRTNDVHQPTLAGWLLFGHEPSKIRQEARIEFSASGPPDWLRSCFGDDIELEESNEEGAALAKQTISGNLWTQLGALTDLLSLVNLHFRLKAEISNTVSAYNALAIKEMIVNAIVHRDYDVNEPITILVDQSSITVESPGGLIEEVAVQAGEKDFQDAIVEKERSIKGYRNPAISDLFYGGGEMDRSGSGLRDMVQLTRNNNGMVTFGPIRENSAFRVVMESRPEAVDELSATALPTESETVRYAANLVPIETLPDRVWHAGTTANSNRSLYAHAKESTVPPGHVSDGRFFSLYDLEAISDQFVSPFDSGDIETMNFQELLDLPNGETIALKLMHEALFEHLAARGLQIDYGRRRAHYPRGEEPEVKVTYRGRARTATRTVVKARTKRDSDDVIYYEHKAFSFSILRFGDDWALVITPGYAFTRDGIRKPISRERTNILSTRRAALDFNQHVMNDVVFWLAVLSNESDGMFALEYREENDLADFGPTVLLSHRMPTISYNVAAFELSDQDPRIVEDMERLEKELEDLANEPEEDDLEEDNTEEDEAD